MSKPRPFSLSLKTTESITPNDLVAQMTERAAEQGLTAADVDRALGGQFSLRIVVHEGTNFEIRRRKDEPLALFFERVRQLADDIERARKKASA